MGTTTTTVPITTSTTTTTTTTVMETANITTPEYFDFTNYFETLDTKDTKQVRFPDGREYFCCCKPDKSKKSVECVLKYVWIESIAELFRRFQRGRCDGAMGKEYHSWNNVYVAKTKAVREEFVGLENLGKCIVI